MLYLVANALFFVTLRVFQYFANMAKTQTSEYHSKDIMEFVTVAMEYCKRLGNAPATSRKDFVSVMLKILPLLYIKAQLVLCFTTEDELYIEHTVSEDDYNGIRNGIAKVMGEYDDFLDVFVSDMKYSDEPIHCSISECLADIFQDIANFLYVFRQDFPETTYAALCELTENFANRWGQILVNVLRPLHEYFYSDSNTNADD